jgi:anti-sigma factor RsiW
MHRDMYLRELDRQAEAAAIQVGAVMRCEHHGNVLLTANVDAEWNAYKLASLWLAQDGTRFMREDLRDAVEHVLERTVGDACPECARDDG